MTHIEDIDIQLDIIKKSLDWARTYHPTNFPFKHFEDMRYRLKMIRFALSEKCSAAAYGESQVGKSYLMSSLLSTATSQFMVSDGHGGHYSFIDQLNPSGGNTGKEESTGVITRFSTKPNPSGLTHLVRIRTLSVTDLILLLADSYYKDVKIDTSKVLDKETINNLLEPVCANNVCQSCDQSHIDSDNILEIEKYFKEIIGNNAVNVINSNFWQCLKPCINAIPPDNWGHVFSLLWNNNEVITRLFETLIAEYKKLNFEQEIYVPFDAVLREKGTILKVNWLDFINVPNGSVDGAVPTSDIYGSKGTLLASSFSKVFLSALTAELTFVLTSDIAEAKPFLKDMDLLDFPGARRRESVHEVNISQELPKMIRRGKVSYLFNKYSRALRINSVLFCQHQDMSGQSEIGESLNSWICANIGKDMDARSAYINSTNKISPFFIVATKFNTDLKWTNEHKGSPLSDRWKSRFIQTLSNEIIKPETYSWFNQYVNMSAGFNSEKFQSIYLLRDFFWSRDQHIYEGYDENKSGELREIIPPTYPEYRVDLKDAFVNFPFVKEHFADPAKSWNEVASLNNDGSLAIIRDFNRIASVIDAAREEKFAKELEEIKNGLKERLKQFYVPDDESEMKAKTKKAIGQLRLNLDMLFGTDTIVLGRIIDTLMLPIASIRTEVHNVVIRCTDRPKSIAAVNVIRMNAGICPNDEKEIILNKLIDYYGCDNEAELKECLSRQSIELTDVLTGGGRMLSTLEDVVTKHIYDIWIAHLNKSIQSFEELLPNSDKLVAMYESLFEKLGLWEELSNTIGIYINTFPKELQPNVISDAASLILNNFISQVGQDKLTEGQRLSIEKNAEILGIRLYGQPCECTQMSFLETLEAFDKSKDLVANPSPSEAEKAILHQLPWWNNFKQWQNNLIRGMLLSNDFIRCNPEENNSLKTILNLF